MLNQTCALDFMIDTLYEGRRFRVPTMIDEGKRDGLAVYPAISVTSPRSHSNHRSARLLADRTR